MISEASARELRARIFGGLITCRVCGREFAPNRKHARYCSKKCNVQRWKVRK